MTKPSGERPNPSEFTAAYATAKGTGEAKTVCIFGVPRGGTSMVAGVAHLCGLDIGRGLPVNFEDPDFNLDLYNKSGHPDPISAMQEVIAERSKSGQMWGWKFPAAARYLEKLKPALRNPHLIVVFRDAVATSSRRLKHGGGLESSLLTVLQSQMANVRLASAWGVPSMFVSYEKAVLNPELFVEQLTSFLGLPMPQDIDQITRFMKAGSYKELPVHDAAPNQRRKSRDMKETAPVGTGLLKAGIDQIRIPNEHLARYIERFKKHELLQQIIDVSLEKLGFFTKHPPRAFEYPWVLSSIPRRAKTVIDLGAGLSPLPFLIADRGSNVTTIDYSDIIRTTSSREKWNEWGYLDYSSLHSSITSQNIDFGLLDLPPGSIDCIYSVSVVEHMPAVVRRRVVAKAAELLQHSGTFILTLDLVPGTLNLWNRDRGKEVESPAIHGTLLDFIQELQLSGIELKSLRIERKLPGSATDICCITAVRNRKDGK